MADLMCKLNLKYNIGLKQRKYRGKKINDDDGCFIKAGFPAAVLNIGSYPYSDPNYHDKGDIPENVDIPNVKMAVQLSLAAVLYLDIYGTSW